MKTLFLGGIKSGKSRLAEEFILKGKQKPIYLATTEFIDAEIQERIDIHQKRRAKKFDTIEEPLSLSSIASIQQAPILIECMSMWLNNMIYHQKTDDEIFHEVETLLKLQQDIVFVLNEVGMGIIPDNALARRFIDLSGKISQNIASKSEQVFFCVAGIPQLLKGKHA